MKIQTTLEQKRGLGAPTLRTVENPCRIYSQPSMSEVPPHLRFYTRRSCSTVEFTAEKRPRVCGPVQFKPMLFKSQLGVPLFSLPGNKHLRSVLWGKRVEPKVSTLNLSAWSATRLKTTNLPPGVILKNNLCQH